MHSLDHEFHHDVDNEFHYKFDHELNNAHLQARVNERSVGTSTLDPWLSRGTGLPRSWGIPLGRAEGTGRAA